MRPPEALPEPFRTRPFAVRDALAAGLSPKRLRARDLDSPYWGTRAAAGRMDLRTRCAALQSRFPAGAYFSHTTAALLLGAPVPFAVERDLRIHVSSPAPGRAIRAKGVVGHWRMPLVTLSELAAAIDAYPGRRGRRTLRKALSLLDDRAESRPESILRVILVLAGLPLPEVNRDIVEAGGRIFARLDLRYPAEKVAIEYQGDYHRENQGQWRRDMSRRARLEANGWYVVEINADDLRDADALVAFVGSVLVKRRAGVL